MKKEIKLIMIIIIIVSIVIAFNMKGNKLKPLPKPEVTEGIRGINFGIDKNINEETIDNYLNRSDTVYRDMRMLIDEGDYESIGGDSYLSGIITGFEAVPFPLILNVTGLPEEVGNTYQGKTLFTANEDGYTANYKESMEFLEYYFPKDKNILLMCGGGGYSGMMKEMLINLGWDKDKIYNTGGHWFYKGDNNIIIKKTINNKVSYDFWKVSYHDINFDTLNKVD
ncbi:MAG: hypothetical protein PHU45_05145 [Bacilli bacterium]|nr:hypothetical protein [Bacilli bacterium]